MEPTQLRVLPGNYKLVYHLENVERKLTGVLKRLQVENPANFVFLGNSHLQKAVARGIKEQALRYHTIVILEGPGLKEWAALSYGGFFVHGSQLFRTDEVRACGMSVMSQIWAIPIAVVH